MKIILHMAISLKGMVARENDDTDFLSHDNWTIFVALAHQTGALLWGRKTHEIVRTYGEEFIQELDGITRIVISSDSHLKLEPGWHVASSPQEAETLLAAADQEQALLVGGARLNTAFAQAGLIDQVIINLESVIVGCGIPLFAPEAFDLPLQLLEIKHVRDEIIQLHYRVRKGDCDS